MKAFSSTHFQCYGAFLWWCDQGKMTCDDLKHDFAVLERGELTGSHSGVCSLCIRSLYVSMLEVCWLDPR